MSKQRRDTVVFLNPRTCGIYKDGGRRFKTDPLTGRRTDVVDNELIEHVEAYLAGQNPPGMAAVAASTVFRKKVVVPTYYDARFNSGIKDLLENEVLESVTIGQLLEEEVISVRGGHGSPGNDQRSGHIPYIKVSDIRGLRVNINPTNLVSESVAKRFWRGTSSGLKAWDLITPNRASSNIGEFAVLLPGEENVVVTKEVFVFRVKNNETYDPFYLLWALSLRATRDQWRRIALMQTNREDCGDRYREIILPKPKSGQWAKDVSRAFREYFTTISQAKESFVTAVNSDAFKYVANVTTASPLIQEAESVSVSEQPSADSIAPVPPPSPSTT